MKKYKIFNNFGLKILAVFISVLLWLAVINVSDPVINTSYADIPVVVVNADSITVQDSPLTRMPMSPQRREEKAKTP